MPTTDAIGCPVCGTTSGPGERFCTVCGSALETKAQPQPRRQRGPRQRSGSHRTVLLVSGILSAFVVLGVGAGILIALRAGDSTATDPSSAAVIPTPSTTPAPGPPGPALEPTASAPNTQGGTTVTATVTAEPPATTAEADQLVQEFFARMTAQDWFGVLSLCADRAECSKDYEQFLGERLRNGQIRYIAASPLISCSETNLSSAYAEACRAEGRTPGAPGWVNMITFDCVRDDAPGQQVEVHWYEFIRQDGVLLLGPDDYASMVQYSRACESA